MKKTILSALILICVGFAQVAAALPISTIGFMPSGGSPALDYSVNTYQFTAQSTGTFSVDVLVSVATGQIVSAYNLDVLYDPGLVVNTGVRFASWLGNPDAVPFPEVMQASKVTGLDGTAGAGVVNFVAGSLLSDAELQSLQGGVYPYITLATLDFDVVTAGDISLVFDWSDTRGTRDVKGLSYLGPDGYPVAEMILPGAAAVPEPGTLLLLSAGLAGVVLLRRKRE